MLLLPPRLSLLLSLLLLPREVMVEYHVVAAFPALCVQITADKHSSSSSLSPSPFGSLCCRDAVDLSQQPLRLSCPGLRPRGILARVEVAGCNNNHLRLRLRLQLSVHSAHHTQLRHQKLRLSVATAAPNRGRIGTNVQVCSTPQNTQPLGKLLLIFGCGTR